MQDFLYDEFDAQVSISTVHNILERNYWSRKAVRARAAERSTLLRNSWIGIQKSWTADQLIFLDKSAANERTSNRKYSWLPVGTIYKVACLLKRSER
jgi:transposase